MENDTPSSPDESKPTSTITEPEANNGTPAQPGTSAKPADIIDPGAPDTSPDTSSDPTPPPPSKPADMPPPLVSNQGDHTMLLIWVLAVLV
ncbi:MAG TPA: hypothetical protein VKQ34_00840, partial [Candidatus Saccharimonadales bacterium]|nr:hypothetical protein [Candidatus Saccharimonadales bacterium]